MFAYVAVVEVTHVGVLQDALQILHREIRQLSIDGQLVEVVHRVTGRDPIGLQMVGLYAGLRVGRQLRVATALLVLAILRAVLYDTRRERSHADLYLAGSLRGQQLHLGSLTLEIFEIIIGDGGDGTAASAPAPAGAHRVEIAVLQIATLVVGAVVPVAVTVPSVKI